MSATRKVVREKARVARDLIKGHLLMPELSAELIAQKGIGAFRFSTALIEWLQSELESICDECKILMKPPAGIFWSRIQSFPISNCVSCSRRRRGSHAAVGIEGVSHHIILCMNSELFSSFRLLKMSE